MNYAGIVLSGLPASGKSSLARELSRVCGWQIYSIGDELKSRWLLGNNGASFEDYVTHLPSAAFLPVIETARRNLETGNAVIDARYTPPYDDLNPFKIFVAAGLDLRIRRALKRYEGKSFEEVRAILERLEEFELRMGRTLFGQDYDYRDPSHYNLVINSEI